MEIEFHQRAQFFPLFGTIIYSILTKYQKTEYFSETGIELAQLLLDRTTMKGIKVGVTPLGNHNGSEKNAMRLNQKICGGRSLTVVVVAAHEVGHAVQAHTGYKPLKAGRKCSQMKKIGDSILQSGC